MRTPGRLNGHSRNAIILECKSPKHLATATYILYLTLPYATYIVCYCHCLICIYIHLITWIEIQLIFTTPIRFYNRPHLFQGFKPIKWQIGGPLCKYVVAQQYNYLEIIQVTDPPLFHFVPSTLSSCTQHLKSKSLGLTFGQGHLRRCRSRNQAR